MKPNIYLAIFLWLFFVVLLFIIRPITVIDETRYLGVAWEMWQQGSFIVPIKNGAFYSDKPPLLFWLMHFTWSIFGVNEFSARIIAPLFSLFSILLTYSIGKIIFFKDDYKSNIAVFILLGSLFWSFANTIVKFDSLVSFFVLLAIWSLLKIIFFSQKKYWCLFSMAICLGILAKGPVLFIHIIPLAIIMPIILKKNVNGWYLKLFLFTTLGIILSLIWLIPSTYLADSNYRNAIFYDQHIGRIFSNENKKITFHHQPIWWYVLLIFVGFLPWIASRSFFKWSMIKNIDTNQKFLIIWFLLPFIIFSLISAKQLFYLLPEFSALALLLASFIPDYHKIKAKSEFIVAILVLLFASFILLLPKLSGYYYIPPWVYNLPNWSFYSLLVIGLLFLFFNFFKKNHLIVFVLFSLFFLIINHFIFYKMLHSDYDVSSVAQVISAKEKNHTIVHIGPYHNQYHFFGRLAKPLIELNTNMAYNWAKKNPNQYMVIYLNPKKIIKKELDIAIKKPYAGEVVIVINTNEFIKDRNLLLP